MAIDELLLLVILAVYPLGALAALVTGGAAGRALVAARAVVVIGIVGGAAAVQGFRQTPRMEYTATAFAEPLRRIWRCW